MLFSFFNVVAIKESERFQMGPALQHLKASGR